MNKKNQKLAKQIYDISHITGKFLLRSGRESDEYFDKYLFEARPALLKEICRAMSKLIPAKIDMLAGLEMGGIPLVTMLSQSSKKSSLFVRKKAKKHGTCKLAEGENIKGKKIVIIEDVVTSGGQIILSAQELRSLGAKIECVLCVIDREAGGAENLARIGLKLKPLFTMSELKKSALGKNK
ncbi:MAG: orotate phosphoribosyltransferase [Patescibacteria group bacterium]